MIKYFDGGFHKMFVVQPTRKHSGALDTFYSIVYETFYDLSLLVEGMSAPDLLNCAPTI